MENLAASLIQDYDGLTSELGGDKLKIVDPVVETPMVLNIEQISLYEKNPRTFRNPKYDDIKASIKAEGLKQPLCVTRRPGETNYVVEAGGNTRLSILRDLFEETSDQKYAKVSVIFKPWKNNSNVLVSHLIENELRGEMCFVDTAKAICDLKVSLDAELGKTLSWRKFEEVLVERGLPYSHTQISRMRFLVEQLLRILPEERLSTFGSHHTQVIQSAISEAKKHYNGELDFIDYYECSIKSFFTIFSSIEAVANAIVSLVKPDSDIKDIDERKGDDVVQAEPKKDISEIDETPESPISPEMVASNSTEDKVVQAEPLANSELAHLQKIILLRAENYDLACVILNEFCVGVRDTGVGFEVNPDGVKPELKTTFSLLNHLIDKDKHELSLLSLSQEEPSIQYMILNVMNNIHQMLLSFKVISQFTTSKCLDSLSNEEILNIQLELDTHE